MDRARLLRKKATQPERILWRHLRNRNFAGYKFRRQHPFEDYVLDFVCLEAKLIVELDGAQHEGSIVDRHRTQDLMRIGFAVVRFSNDDVRRDIDEVCARILRIAQRRR